MSAIAWVVVVVAVVVALGAIGYVVAGQSWRRHPQDRFGPEYDRVVQETDSRRDAEQQLLDREAWYADLDIRPLDGEARDMYAKKWREVQERFVDAPSFAVTEADALVTAVMADRGYPTEQFEERVERPVRRTRRDPRPLPRGPLRSAGGPPARRPRRRISVRPWSTTAPSSTSFLTTRTPTLPARRPITDDREQPLRP